jgi:hypothetical protein
MDIAEMILPDGGGERSGFVVSHPCGGKKPQGWGTEYLWKDHVLIQFQRFLSSGSSSN